MLAYWIILEMAGGSTSQTVLDQFGARSPGLGSWRLLPSIFLHAGLAHLLVNLMSLVVLGGAVESMAGTEFFLFAFLFAGVGGGFTSLTLNPGASSVGCSGAVCGLLAVLFFLTWWAPELTPHLEAPRRSGLTFSLIFVALLQCKPYQLDGHWADTAQHWGGLLFGFLSCLSLQRREGRIRVNRLMAVSLSAWLVLCALCYDPGPNASPKTGPQPRSSIFAE
jgi:membrane associated rhomboid family serine protease